MSPAGVPKQSARLRAGGEGRSQNLAALPPAIPMAPMLAILATLQNNEVQCNAGEAGQLHHEAHTAAGKLSCGHSIWPMFSFRQRQVPWGALTLLFLRVVPSTRSDGGEAHLCSQGLIKGETGLGLAKRIPGKENSQHADGDSKDSRSRHGVGVALQPIVFRGDAPCIMHGVGQVSSGARSGRIEASIVHSLLNAMNTIAHYHHLVLILQASRSRKRGGRHHDGAPKRPR